VGNLQPAQTFNMALSKCSVPKLENNIASKQDSLTNKHVDSKSRDVSLSLLDVVYFPFFFWKMKTRILILN